MSTVRIIVPAVAGSLLIASIFGILLFGLDYSVVWLGESFMEMIGVLPPGWADSHVGWTFIVASIITAPLIVAIIVLTFRQILRVESALALDEKSTA